MEDKRVLKREGRSLTIDKETLDDQKILEVGTNIPDNAKVDKDDKTTFEDYKVLYKGAIDDKCIATYGTCDDTKLWEDIAKEMFLKSSLYVPNEETKSSGDLVKKESKRIIKHNKKVENKNSKTFKVKVNTPFGEMEFDQKSDSQENANKEVLDKVKSAFRTEYQNKVSLIESKLIETNGVEEYYENKSDELDKVKECPKQL